MPEIRAFDPTPRTWDALLSRAAERWPGSELAFPTERTTYAELDRAASDHAAGLRAAGVAPGDHVGILLPAGVECVSLMLAVARLGAVIVPISNRFKAAELRHVVRHAELTTVVTTDAVAEHVDFPALLTDAFPAVATHPGGALAIADAPRLRRLLMTGDGPARPGFALLPAADVGAAPPAGTHAPADPAFLMFTSGTSAQPKACVLSHAAITLQAQALAETRYALTADDAFWCPLPLFHNGGISTLTACLTVGARFCHGGHFDPSGALEQLQRERCTHWIPTFETIIMQILEHPRIAEFDLSSLRMGVAAGTPEFLRRFQRLLPTSAVVSNYGSTEAAGSAVMSLPDDDLRVRTETSGRALPLMELRIADPDTDAPVAVGGRGEIRFRGAMRFDGYYADPEQTAAAIDADGWFRTGDIGSLDADGRLAYHGRLKDMLKVGGENVAAAEIEAHLQTHPGVSVVAVVGARDARYTEVPCAFVMPSPGAELDEAELIAFCVGRIANFKVPRYVRFVDEWPMSGTKIKKYLLRARIEDELDASGVRQAPRVAARSTTTKA
jgi:fatty-acyl-CoA synthase